jgi:hypothetical protein
VEDASFLVTEVVATLSIVLGETILFFVNGDGGDFSFYDFVRGRSGVTADSRKRL